jgi:two-component system chemotaxis sensor kinase CheA
MVCRLPAGSDWARTILEPLVEAAGYRISTDENEEADVAIELAEAAETPSGPARSTIRLRPEPDAPQDETDSIYRYDREALMAALKQARTEKRA